MQSHFNALARVLSFAVAVAAASSSYGGVSFLATQYDVGQNYPTYSYPQNSIVPWRSDTEANFYSVSQEINQRYYGRDGWALFATRFDFPNADTHDSQQGGVPANAFLPTSGSPDYPNIVRLPNFISASKIYSTRMAGGWAYALLDDPRKQAGPRQWTFDGVNYPPAHGDDPILGPSNVTGVVPYVKMGILDGGDTLGNSDPKLAPAARWGFQVGPNVPSSFRLGVITDGLDGVQFAPDEVFLTRLVNNMAIETVSSGTLDRDRLVDMHFFDITNAQPGEQFLISAKAPQEAFASAGIAGFSFDVFTPFEGSQVDLDGNGVVDGGDVLIAQRNLGNPGGLGDVDSSGLVNQADFDAITSAFQSSVVAATGAIPEPATGALVVGGAGLLLARLRRRL